MYTDKVKSILDRARESGVSFFVEEEKLKMKIPKGKRIQPDLLKEIDEWKTIIKDFFISNRHPSPNDIRYIKPRDKDLAVQLPLSYAQERLWFIDKLQGTIHYHMPWVFRLEGVLNLNALENAFREIVRRHETLRTVIREEAGAGRLHLLPAEDWQLTFVNAGDLLSAGTDIASYIGEQMTTPYDLAADFMLKVYVINNGENEHTVLTLVHHIAFDGWSVSILVNELTQLYSSAVNGNNSVLNELPVQYADYALWQRTYLNDQLMDEQLAYWKRQLKDLTPLSFPTDYTRPAIQSTKGNTIYYRLDTKLSKALRQLAQQEEATLYMTMLAAFKVLLYQYTGQSDICVGSAVAGRKQPELKSLIGFFVNTLAMRTEVRHGMPFTTLLQQVKATVLEAYNQQDIPFEKVVESLKIDRDLSRNALFQHMFVFHNTPPVKQIDLGNIKLTPDQHAVIDSSKFDFEFSVTDDEDGIHLKVNYCTDLFEQSGIERLIKHYERLLQIVTTDKHEAVGRLSMLSVAERQQLLYDFNDTAIDYGVSGTIVDLIEAQVALTPDHIALVQDDRQLTYRQLDHISNQLAHYLIQQGVSRENPLTPLCMDRSPEMVIAILGVLKAGGAYVPIDPAFPAIHIANILEDTGARLIVTAGLTGKLRTICDGLQVVDLQTDLGIIERQPGKPPANRINIHDLAYVIYTSGSTGKPKGVLNEHAGLLNRLLWTQQYFNLTQDDCVLQKTTYTFDVSVWEILWPLFSGARLVLAKPEGQKDARYLKKLIDDQHVTLSHFVPSMLELFLEETGPASCPTLKKVLCSGEQLKPAHVKRFHEKLPHVALYNLYGPTEAAIDVTCWAVPMAQEIRTVPIGKPVANTSLFILNGVAELVPVGVPGELCIGGVQVARGYLNRSSLTAEKFIDSPFLTGDRLYRTGDMARWLPDGNIEYLGRIDDQVKIRGYRVELGEVESVLQAAPGVKQGVVVAREDGSGSRRLIGFVVPSGMFDRTAIQRYLSEQLPEYMVPSLLLSLDKLPLTSTGKVNRQALPAAIADDQRPDSYVAAQTLLEQQLCGIWQKILGVHRVGITDNFFELGGHSLLVIRVVAAIRRELERELSVKDLFLYPTVSALTAYLESTTGTTLLPAVTPRLSDEAIPLSFSQERLWFIDKLQGSRQYHMPWVFRLHGSLDVAALTDSFRAIVDRHSVLRTVVYESEGIGYQQLLPSADWSPVYMRASDLSASGQDLEEYLSAELDRAYDLSRDMMLRVHLIEEGPDDHVLLVMLHHIAFDGWSVSLLVKELGLLYRSLQSGEGIPSSLPLLPVQYADYAAWQRHYLSGALLSGKLSYWKQQLSGVSVLELPSDYVRPAVQSGAGGEERLLLPASLSTALTGLSQSAGVTLYMTLLSAFKVLLYRYSGQEDICVGTPVAGRHQQEVESLMGFFVNTLALRSQVSGGQRFIDLLASVKTTTLSAYDHQDVPFEKVVEVLGVERDMSRSAVFQVMFIMQQDIAYPDLGTVTLAPVERTELPSRFDLEMNVTLSSTGLELQLVYSKDLYKADSIQRMLGHYEQLLHAIVASQDTTIDNLPMLTSAEYTQILTDFNPSPQTWHTPSGTTVLTLFEEQAALHPDAIALVYEDQQLSYSELNAYANQLGSYLRTRGIGPDVRVPVCADRSLDLVVSILGILKSGGAYVPIDPDYPEDRIRYMLQDTGANILLSAVRNQSLSLHELFNGEVIDVINNRETISREPSENLTPVLGSSHLAYIIYTSGSTGKPKGVMVEHGNLASVMNAGTVLFDFNQHDVWTAFHSFSFDFSVWEIFMPLCTGAKVIMPAKDTVMDVSAFGNLLEHHQVTVLNQTPSAFYALQEHLLKASRQLDIRYVIFGGEALSPALLEQWAVQYPACNLINMYGITEITIHATFKQIDEDCIATHTSNIGHVIPTLQAYVLGNNLQPVPVGVPGELYIGGQGVARGYFNNADLTAARFISNPFVEGQRLYKSGDLVRRLPDGEMEYLGRIDDQVKIRGYRIELNEVSLALQQAPGIRQAVVIARDDSFGNKQLLGYVVPDISLDKAAVFAYLRTQLPEYMIPAFLVAVSHIPLTANGKVDKKKLPPIDTAVIPAADYTAPVTPLQEDIAAVWQAILNIERIGIHDNFFESGGHSLLVTRCVSALRSRLGIEVSVRDIFVYPTIAALSAQLTQQQPKDLLPPITPQPRPARIPLSFAQERLWFIDSLQGSVQYHMPWVFRIYGIPDLKVMEHAFRHIINRHEVIRTLIHEEDGIAYQEVISEQSWKLRFTDESRLTDSNILHNYIQQQVSEPFNLSADYMLRAELIRLDDEEYVLLVVMHHIASDGWSLPIMLHEMVAIYDSFMQNAVQVLPALPVQYADYALWQRNYLEGRVMDQQLQYWKEQLKDVIPLKVPTDYPRPLVQSTRGSAVYHKLDPILSEQLQQFSKREGVTLFMTLLTAFKALLHRYTGEKDICTGSPIAGRKQLETEELIGFFVNTLALRCTVNEEDTLRRLLEQIKAVTLEAYEYQDTPFEKVVEAIAGKREVDANPLFHIVFALQNTPELPALELNGLVLSNEVLEDQTAVFDLLFELRETPEGILLKLRYSTALFSEATIHGYIAHYEQILSTLVENAERKIGDIALVTAKEREQLLFHFNQPPVLSAYQKTVVALFEEQVRKSPDATALVFENVQLSYRRLNEQANQLARYLRNKGVGRDTAVPVLMYRSADLIVSILGILKAGGAYMPVDPEYPVERILFMLNDTGSSLVLTETACLSQLRQSGDSYPEIIDIQAQWPVIAQYTGEDLPPVNQVSDLAYIMYTSGSTGKPKGVLVEHLNIVSLATDQHYAGFSAEDILLSTGSPSFDASTFEYWSMLLNGGQLVICSRDTLLTNELLKEVMTGRNVSKMWFTASWFNQLVEWDISIFSQLDTILVGGEKLSEDHIQRLRSAYPDLKIVNGYGPTENTTFSLTYLIKESGKIGVIPIGRPLQNRTAYVLNPQQQLCPVGVPGELYVGGAGVARGYLNRPELTAERFVKDPFSEDANARLYKTGDLVKWLPDGNIAYLGRIDDQVKIRGYRIEPGEVENVLNEFDGISAGCVIVKQDSFGGNRLVGYYVPERQVLLEKEGELYRQQVESWQELYETEYGKTETAVIADEEFNIIGWNDSFTGQPIPGAQMREWLDDILNVILSCRPENVLEIGCGTGLIYYGLSDHIRHYTGTDFSSSSVRQIQQRISKGERVYCDTALHVCAAHEVGALDIPETDTIILNSIVQYFPGEQYLTTVISSCLEKLKGSGRIVIGDVRDKRLLKHFKGRLSLHSNMESVPKRVFNFGLEQEVLTEEELCISPEYFYALKSLYPAISHVDIRWKNCTAENELTLYRYTVILHIQAMPPVLVQEWLDWETPGMADNVHTLLSSRATAVNIRNLPNYRLEKERLLSAGIDDPTVSSSGELREYILRRSKTVDEAEQLISAARAQGYHCTYLLHEDALKLNIILSLQPVMQAIAQVYQAESSSFKAGTYTNMPLYGTIIQQVQKELRSYMLGMLPDYMTPSELLSLPFLPLTDNGKIDRQLLLLQGGTQEHVAALHQLPSGETALQLAAIWQELLGISRIGINDDFFELGGHSLLATRAVSAIRKQLGMEIMVKDMFLYPTIARLSVYLESRLQRPLLPPVTARTHDTMIPLSFAQERLWFIDKLQGSVAYHMPWIFRLTGNPDIAALEQAFREIVRRHEVLRSVLRQGNKAPYQEIIDGTAWRMEYYETPALTDPTAFEQYVHKWFHVPFDLSNDYMLRVRLLKLSAEEYVLLVLFHHIAFDGWSVSVMVREMIALYRSYRDGRESALPELTVQYADYALWQHEHLNGEMLETQLAYWKNRLQDIKPLYLPTDYPRTAIQSTHGDTKYFYLDSSLTAQLRHLSREQGVTLFMTMLAVFKVLLYRYTHQEDICTGVAIANRTQKETESLIGFFVNALALRSKLNNKTVFSDFLQQVKAITLEGYTYQDVPFEKVIEAVVGKRDVVGNPLIQVMFVLQNTPEIPSLEVGDVTFTGEVFQNVTSKFDLTFDLREKPDTIEFRVEFCDELFTGETITRMFGHYVHLLEAIVQQVSTPVGQLRMLSLEEEQTLLSQFNKPQSALPAQTFISLFEQQVLITPQHTAVFAADAILTYQELNERANRFSNYLQRYNPGQHALVPVCLDRSALMMVCILGILKAGYAYVPIDPSYPQERIRFMLEDTGASLAVSVKQHSDLLQHAGNLTTVIEIDEQWDQIESCSAEKITESPQPGQLAYTIYTSGSTGRPKGVMVEHGNLLNYLLNSKRRYIDEDNNEAGSLLNLPYTFDASLTSMFVPLLGGKSVVIGTNEALKVFESRLFMDAAPYDFIKLTPSHMSLLQNAIGATAGGVLTKRLVIGGEALQRSHIQFLLDSNENMEVINEYGPTEATVGCSVYSFNTRYGRTDFDHHVPIGKPLDNVTMYILSADMLPVPVGVAGEIYIGGAGVARGYLNRPELTAARFIKDPFSKEAGARLYKTGDMAKWLPDGNMVYLGRMDDQVKIRGYRIEPGEVENVLSESPGLAAACVVVKQDTIGMNKLVGYYVADKQLLRQKEDTLYRQQVENWQALYETEYGKTEAVAAEDEEFNIIGWNDSFTGQQIPSHEMREWLNDILEVILSCRPENVLEIGTGMGLIYYGLSDHISHYTGTDFSSSSIRQIERHISRKERPYCQTSLHVCAAHEVAALATGEIDTIVLNSIIQYFPGEAYLTTVIASCIGKLNGHGQIVIGDVRDLRLLKSFKGRLALERNSESLSKRVFGFGIEQELLNEEELCISPAYFYGLQSLYPEISYVDIRWKQCVAENELTLYRYTVILHVGEKPAVQSPKWLDWETTGVAEKVSDLLDAGAEMISIRNLPNYRLEKERLLLAGLEVPTIQTSGELREYISRPSSAIESIEKLILMAQYQGYYCRYLLHEDVMKLNLVLSRESLSTAIEQVFSETNVPFEAGAYTNMPLYGAIIQQMQQEVRNHLQEVLPDYMVPSELIAIPLMPLTENGKTNRQLLIAHIGHQENTTTVHQPPSGELQEHLAAIWQELLGITRISVYDDFFELGGHSLLAVRMVVAIRKQLQIEVDIQTLFVHTTIASLSQYLEQHHTAALLPAITTQPRDQAMPLSFAQERLWFIDKLQGSKQYHMPWVFRLHGPLDVEALTAAFRVIVERHEVLRTVIAESDGVGYQHLLPSSQWSADYISQSDLAVMGADIETYLSEELNRPYDLSRDMMLRVHIINKGPEEHVLFVMLHHIAFDGWSVSLLVNELSLLYRSLHAGEGIPSSLPVLPVQYADYAIWQRNYLSGDVLARKLDYWRGQLSGVAVLELPLDYVRPAIQRTEGDEERLVLDPSLYAELLKVSQQEGVTLYMTLLSAFKALLYRYSGQEDICVGTPVANRQQHEVETLMGFFVNTLALRSQVHGKMSFRSLLQAVKSTTLSAYDHQDVPFEKVVEILGVERDMSRSSVFQVVFVMQNTLETGELDMGDLMITSESGNEVTSRFDLKLSATELDGSITLSINYRVDLFRKDTINRMLAHYEQMLLSVVSDVNRQIGAIKILSVAEERMLLSTFNNTDVTLPDKTIIQLFEEQVKRTPDHTALMFEGATLTFAELEERAAKLGHYLQSCNIGPETFVPICIDRSLEMMVGILGILKAGGAYVPIDPNYPEERIAFMLEDTAAHVVVTLGKFRHLLQARGQVNTIIALDEDSEMISMMPASPVNSGLQPGNLLYVIYTSGSTGKPKGVLLEHRSLVNFLFHQAQVFNISKEDRILQFYNFCFDASAEQIFLPLITGATMVLIRDTIRLDLPRFEAFMREYRITHLQATPGFHYNLSADKYGGLKRVVSGGEICNIELWERWKGICSFYNKYGPTESAISATEYHCSADIDLSGMRTVPIGKPVSNTRIYILDAGGTPVPVGVSGELCIGGVQVARGYLNRPSLTAEKFIDSPFLTGDRLYRTGDMARWLPDGNIEYLGRIDDQVKIRGYRVELGEVESVLQAAPGVKQGVVVAREDGSGSRRLIGFVVPSGMFDRTAIQRYLSEQLPEYMVPSLLLSLDKLPLTSTGKVNRQALPAAIADDQRPDSYVAAQTLLEQQLCGIWQNILGVHRVGITDNFFELGGHSLLVIRVVAAIRRELERELSVKDLFLYPTVSALTAYLESTTGTTLLPAVTPRLSDEAIPLSFSQERLWFIDKLQGSRQYHMPWVFRLYGPLDVAALTDSFRAIVDRHSVLRTVVYESEGIGYQQLLPSADWSPVYMRASDLSASGQDLEEYLSAELDRAYDLSRDMMLRVHLIEEGPDDHVLLVMLHHIAFDGWSVSLLVKELGLLYRSLQSGEGIPSSLPVLPVQYADYAAWQRHYLSGALLSGKLSYWKQQLSGVSVLELPSDYVRPAVQSGAGGEERLLLPASLSTALTGLSQSAGVTLYMTLLSAFKVLLYRYSGQEDICVGTPVAGRHQQEVESLMGFFVNTLALRSQVIGGQRFIDLLASVKTTTLSAYDHQDVPFEKVVEVLGVERDMSRGAVFQVMFSLQHAVETEDFDLGNVTLSALESTELPSRFDLEMNVTLSSTGLELQLVYSKDLYKADSIQRMLGHYEQLLHAIVASQDTTIDNLPMLSAAENTQILTDFNPSPQTWHTPSGTTVLTLFEEQAALHPDAIALVYEDQQLSYSELNARANQLGSYLRARGIGPEVPVPVCADRSLELMVCILGVLKSGGAYVPIDPDYPEDRIRYMLEDTGAGVILSAIRKRSLSLSKLFGGEVIDVINWGVISTEPLENLVSVSEPAHLAYMIYTSGSTGKPKGVMVEHGNLLNIVYSWRRQYELNQFKPVLLSLASISFDVFTGDFCKALTNGGTMVLIDKEQHMDMRYLQRTIQANQVNILESTPGLVLNLVKQFEQSGSGIEQIRLLVIGSEMCTAAHYEELRSSCKAHTRLLNSYGVTEATIDTSYFEGELNGAGIVPVGPAMDNMRYYILDASKQVVPVGVPGELFIAGTGVSRGYAGAAAKENIRFTDDPFYPGSRMYRTGDRARWRADGQVELIGRIDSQVKISGYRIELSEIESVLNTSPAVRQAVVVDKADSLGNKRLVGFIVPETVLDKQQLSDYLRQYLPAYMVPSVFVSIDQVPVTPNGKTDKDKLRKKDISNLTLHIAYEPPRNLLEEGLANIWQELLNVPQAGINDNFFELGGNSIITIQVVSRARRLGYELQVSDLFNYQTIAGISAALEQRNAVSEDGQPLSGECGLLPIQQAYLENAGREQSPDNQSVLLSIRKEITLEVVNEVVNRLLLHHDSLRFVYHQDEAGNWRQAYGDQPASVMYCDLSFLSAGIMESSMMECCNNYQRQLDILKGVLMKVVLIQTNVNETYNRLFITIHRLAIDNASWHILLEDLETLFTAAQEDRRLTTLVRTASYRQWYQQLVRYGQSRRLQTQLAHWQQSMTAYQPLPANDKPGREAAGHCIARLGKMLTQHLLEEISPVYHTEVTDILLAALAKALCEWSGRLSVVIGMNGDGRVGLPGDIDVRRTIGWFNATYPVQLKYEAELGAASLIKGVKETLRQVPDNGIGYGVLRYLLKEEVLQSNTWDLLFSYTGQADNVLRSGQWLQEEMEPIDATVSTNYPGKERIRVDVKVLAGELVVRWDFNEQYHTSTAIQALSVAYMAILEELIKHCQDRKEQGVAEYTPADYGLSGEITHEELEGFLNNDQSGTPEADQDDIMIF
ncbi:non-ribosomal peptide synthase/polyketide synthase [Chitinophaga rhizophila]|uniref:Non-ribosomal peptide synthase/polyketide synthase n=1 Tax=Chitinophaga rhizophila TaxID=2866212 RepID=A0ABS7G6N6_9BACT|nr:non-ribosomal peptide synthase/polyketide synthase [Chitinophaga rhizophila]MBW8683317.1 non-ribosomal peptide synthase/polyketide synthase [Chitinophaga rhizophila]